MTTNKQDELVEGYLKVQLDYAPEVNGKKFQAWCEKYGFDYLASGRRAWCSSLQTYFRGASGVTFCDGEMMLFYDEDVSSKNSLINSEVSRVLSELETHKNKATDINLELHGRRDCKNCRLVEDLEAFIQAKRKEYE